MVDGGFTVEVDYEDGFREGFLHGFMAAVAAPDEDESDDAAACDDCTCAVSDREQSVEKRSVRDVSSFGEEVRDFLTKFGVVSDDEIVSRVEVCPESVTVYVEDW